MKLETFTFLTNIYTSLSATLSEGLFKSFRGLRGKTWVAISTSNCNLTLLMERLVWMKTVKIICISDYKDHSNYDYVRLFYTFYVRIYIQKYVWPKIWQTTGVRDLACSRIDCDGLKLTVHNSHVYCDMCNEVSTIQDKEKPPHYTSCTSYLWINHLVLGRTQNNCSRRLLFFGIFSVLNSEKHISLIYMNEIFLSYNDIYTVGQNLVYTV